MKAIRISLMVLLVLALGGCNFYIFDGAPSVTLAVAKTILNSGEIVVLNASVSHGSGPLTYKWEENGVDVLVNSPEYAYSKFVTSSKDITLKVSPASNGNWGPDQLRPNIVIIALCGSWDLSGVPAGNWDLKMVSFNSVHTWTLFNQPVSASVAYSWTLTN